MTAQLPAKLRKRAKGRRQSWPPRSGRTRASHTNHTNHVRIVTNAARQAAIDTALVLAAEHDVYVIHSPCPAGASSTCDWAPPRRDTPIDNR